MNVCASVCVYVRVCICLHMCDMLLYKGAYIVPFRVAVVALLVMPCHALYLKWGIYDNIGSYIDILWAPRLTHCAYRVFSSRLFSFVFGSSVSPCGVLSAFCFLACLTFQIHIESSAYLHTHTHAYSIEHTHTHTCNYFWGALGHALFVFNANFRFRFVNKWRQQADD